jgi:hypothetical protein
MVRVYSNFSCDSGWHGGGGGGGAAPRNVLNDKSLKINKQKQVKKRKKITQIFSLFFI